MKEEWQPIETMTEKGIRFIAGNPDIVIGDVYYGKGVLSGDRNETGYFEAQMVECFRYTETSNPLADNMQPTHWMPLPEPPKTNHQPA